MTTPSVPPHPVSGPGRHPQVPPPDVTPVFAALTEVAAAERGLPPAPWPLPPVASPKAVAQAAEARARGCPLCDAPSGAPCSLYPAGDHLARYLDAYTAGRLTREFMAAVLGELVVIAGHVIIQGGAM